MRKQPAPPSPKPAQTDPATPSESRTTRHRADQSPVRNQRPGLPHTQIIGNTDDAILGKINDGQQVCWPPPSPTPTSATTSTPAASTPKPTPRSSSPSWKPCPARRSSSLTTTAAVNHPPDPQPHTRGGKSADNAVSGERRAPKGRQRGRSPRHHPACRTHHPPASRTTMPTARCSGSAGTLPHTWLRSEFRLSRAGSVRSTACCVRPWRLRALRCAVASPPRRRRSAPRVPPPECSWSRRRPPPGRALQLARQADRPARHTSRLDRRPRSDNRAACPGPGQGRPFRGSRGSTSPTPSRTSPSGSVRIGETSLASWPSGVPPWSGSLAAAPLGW